MSRRTNPFNDEESLPPARNAQLSCLRGLVRGVLAGNDLVQAGQKWARTQGNLACFGEIHLRVGRRAGMTLAAISILKDRFAGKRVLWFCMGPEQAARIQGRYPEADVIPVEAVPVVGSTLAGPYACIVLDPGSLFGGLRGKEFRRLALELADENDFRLLVLG